MNCHRDFSHAGETLAAAGLESSLLLSTLCQVWPLQIWWLQIFESKKVPLTGIRDSLGSSQLFILCGSPPHSRSLTLNPCLFHLARFLWYCSEPIFSSLTEIILFYLKGLFWLMWKCFLSSKMLCLSIDIYIIMLTYKLTFLHLKVFLQSKFFPFFKSTGEWTQRALPLTTSLTPFLR